MPSDRRARKAPGALPLTDERDLYIGLMRQGVSNAEACRNVGVHLRTGYRWRDLAAVAAELNARPRRTLGWETPAGRLDRLVMSTP